MKHFTLMLFASLFAFASSYAQTQFWSDTYEDTGAPSSGTRTPEADVQGGPSIYFMRTSTAFITTNTTYTGMEGTKFWAGEDHDGLGGDVELQIDYTIPAVGLTNLQLTCLLAGNNGLAWEAGDYIIIEYSFDGTTYTKSLDFECSGATKQLALDTDGDLVGDGTSLNYTFAPFTKSIPGTTGTTFYLRVRASANGGAEEWAIDNIRLTHIASCTAPTITANPPNRSACNGNNTTFSANASGATAFQWQENTGSGFVNITNGGIYSGATTTTLTLTGVSSGMTGNQYRMVAINGVASCFTNTNAGSLTISTISTSSNSQTNVACFGGSNGAASVSPSGGIAPYAYSWSPTGGTGAIATGLTAGTYTVTVTDNIACTATKNFTITQSPALTGTTVVTNVFCNGGNNGAINLTPGGGAGGYTFNWGGGVTTEDRTGLAAATYAVIITDANSCTKSVTGITVTQPTAAVGGTTTVTNTSCNGGTNGVIDLTPTGGTSPYTYNWGGGVTTQDRISLAAGTYSVIITDNNGCTGVVSGITVTQPTAVTGTTVVTNVACFGGNNGAINLTPTGGASPYTFAWGGGITTEDRTSLVAGTYSVTITDNNGCTGTVSPTVTQPTAAVSGTTVVTNVACFGNSTGAINLTPTGGTGPYTFNWASGPTTEDRTGLAAGTYSVTITDNNGCTGTVSPTVTQPAAAVSGTRVVTNVSCFGGNNGAINLTPTGGVGPYTFNWVGGATTEDRTGLTAGTYSVTITDANACTGTVSGITVTQPTAAVSGTTVVTNVSCNSGTNGAINLTPTGGTSPYTFNWVGGATTEDRTGLAAGAYSVTITDNNGCTGTVSGITVTQPTAISLTASSQTNVSCNGGSNGAVAVNNANGGTPGYTYNWIPGTPTGDGTTSITGLTAGTWTCTVTDANGCVASQSFTVTQPTAISFTAAAQTNVACFGNTTGSFSVNPALGGAGSFTYDWAPGTPTGDGTTTVTGLAAGTYSVTATDANSCTATITFTITQPAAALSVTPAAQTNVSCNGGSNGAAAINTPTGGTPGYSYNWTPGNPTGDGTTSVTGLSQGTYTVTVTDANACTTSQSFTLTQPTAISVTAASQTNIACNGGSNGAAAINTPTGGAGGYTYDWAPGTPTGDGTTSVNGLTAGTWTVNVTDANGCTASQSFIVTQPTAISFTAAAQTNVACFGGATGAFTVNPALGGTGAFTYDWNPGTPAGDGTTSVTNLTAGSYSVTATDNNGCTASISFTITEPAVIAIIPTSQANVSCNGGANGSASIFVSGGTPGMTYSWSPTGGTNANAGGLSAGTYTVTVTDANGCQATQDFTITEPTALDVSAGSQTNVICNGASTGSATVVPTGGTGNYDYSWSPSGGTAATAAGLTAGTYTVTVTDDNNCQATQTYVITESAALTSSFSHDACNSYTWGTQTHTSSGTYTQTFTSVNGCDSIVTLTLAIVSEVTNTVTENSCVSYTWAQNGMTYTTSGMYVDTIPAVGGCDSIVTLDLTINVPTSSSSSEFACGTFTWSQNGMTYTASGTYVDTISNVSGCDSIVTLNLTIGGTSTLQPATACGSYTWSATGLTYTTSGMYFDTLVAANGCDSIQILDLTINPSVVATAADNGNGTMTASTGTTYQWINCTTNTAVAGATAQTFAPTANGFYSVLVTNASGCSDTSDCVEIDNLGLSDLSSASVQVFPNPTEDVVKISMSVNSANLTITDAQGKTLYVGQIINDQQVNLASYEDGIYFLSIETEKGKVLKRIVKN